MSEKLDALPEFKTVVVRKADHYDEISGRQDIPELYFFEMPNKVT